MAKDLIHAFQRPDPRVFDWIGRGWLRYATALGRAIERHGPLVAVTDIKSCHESINPDALYRLHYLPAELIRWSLDYRNLSFRRVDECQSNGFHASDGNPTGPRGLLQGGPASSGLLTALIGDCVTEVRQAYCQSYADNFALVGSAPVQMQQAVGELTRIVAGYHVGRLEFHEPQFFDARQGFEHLGFHFRLAGERVVIAPNMANSIRIVARIENRIAAADKVEFDAGPAEFIREQAAAFAIMPHMDLSGIAEAADQLWVDEIERRGLATNWEPNSC
jgi:hypothetical protein